MATINIGSDVCHIPWFTANVDIRPEVGPDIVMDMMQLGFKDKCATEINLGNVLEHLAFGDIHLGLEECRRILSDDGTVFITSPLIDKAEESLRKGEIDKERYQNIIKGEGDGFNSHKTGFRAGDIEKILTDCGFTHQPLDLKTFPYLVVADKNNPEPDPWMVGIKASKKVIPESSGGFFG